MPDIPAVSGRGLGGRSLIDEVDAVFRADGVLARALPGFEPRPSQVEMATAVAHAFEAGRVLLAEAGTGTGKTLAYLVPAILSGQRVLVSTGTKNLQEQIFFKDIPLLQQALGVRFSAACMKGRSNYLCLQRLEQLSAQHPDSRTPTAEMFLPVIQDWARRTDSGDRAEIEDLPEDLAFWNDVSSTAETCLGSECPKYDECFVTRMRQRAAESDVVIVNHHLLCADAAVRQSAYGEVIPACSHAIVDEAHQLEDIATQYFGLSVSNYRLEDLAHDIERLLKTDVVSDGHAIRDLEKAIERLRDHSLAFFSEVAWSHRAQDRQRGEERLRATASSLAGAAEQAAHLTGVLDVIEATLSLAKVPRRADEEEGEALEGVLVLARRAGELRDEIRFLLSAGDPEFVYYVEFRGRGVFLRASPIDVSRIVRDFLFDRMRTTVLTSATLTVDGRFDYVRGRLGVEAADEVKLVSEFDYTRQAILYLPPRMPDPRSTEFAGAAAREVVEILRRTQGRAFVLFTSYSMLRAVQGVAELALDYPILVQGTAPRSQLIRQFRETPHAVLLATSSFWQGVDVIGEALSCVIIDKLPFASPGDPITAARIESLRDGGGDPFGDYQVPLAILTLQQGLGRLIRHRQDRGVLAILDPRLRTKGYGRRFIASLPPAPVVQDPNRISEFFRLV